MAGPLARLGSMKLAIALVSYFALSCVLATLVPQGRESAFYYAAYPGPLAGFLVRSGFSSFFSSLLFILPAALFFANLAACAVARLLRELRKKARKRHGPDILHLGLLLLIVGAVLSFSFRREGSAALAIGDEAELPDGRTLRLDSFEYLSYDDGRPKDWISTVSVLDGDGPVVESFPIRVNHPLKLGGLTVYQASHSSESVLALRDAAGAERLIARGGEIEAEGTAIFFMARDDETGRFALRVEEGGVSTVLRVAPGDAAGPFVVAGPRERDLSGLQAVKDPGYGIVLGALLLSVLGIFATFFRKLGDLKP